MIHNREVDIRLIGKIRYTMGQRKKQETKIGRTISSLTTSTNLFMAVRRATVKYAGGIPMFSAFWCGQSTVSTLRLTVLTYNQVVHVTLSHCVVISSAKNFPYLLKISREQRRRGSSEVLTYPVQYIFPLAMSVSSCIERNVRIEAYPGASFFLAASTTRSSLVAKP